MSTGDNLINTICASLNFYFNLTTYYFESNLIKSRSLHLLFFLFFCCLANVWEQCFGGQLYLLNNEALWRFQPMEDSCTC
jgi:hypothetical protein